MDFPDRYMRNMTSVTAQEQEKLRRASVFVAGCGGLGGYVIELLARAGVGSITGVDGDVFQPSNLNRQLFCTEASVGMPKAAAAEKRVSEINSDVSFNAVCEMINSENAPALIAGHDVIIDALDNPQARLVLSHAASEKGIPLVHGAIAGFRARVYTVMPGDGMIEALCASDSSGAEKKSGNLSFTACMCAALQASEAVKLILGKGSTAAGRLIEIDLLNNAFDTVDVT